MSSPRSPESSPSSAPTLGDRKADHLSSAPTLGDRKADHLALCATGDVGFRAQGTLLDDVRLVHDALPELSYDEVDLRVEILGKTLRAPIFIAAMTGGTDQAGRVNRALAAVAERRGYGFGLGSQRPMLRDPSVRDSFAMREVAPSTLILGNVGGVQLVQESTARIQSLVRAVGADAVCVHLNPAMELVQREGDRDFRGILSAIERLNHELGLPVVVKETGCGIGPATADKLMRRGVRHIDVSGAGGTSWVGVETLRAQGHDPNRQALGEAFWDWGVPTAVSVRVVSRYGFETVLATGGLSTGMDVARALVLGAHAAGIARPALRAWHEGGSEGVEAFFDGIEAELRAAMLLTGCRTVGDLRRLRPVIGGALATWLTALGG